MPPDWILWAAAVTYAIGILPSVLMLLSDESVKERWRHLVHIGSSAFVLLAVMWLFQAKAQLQEYAEYVDHASEHISEVSRMLHRYEGRRDTVLLRPVDSTWTPPIHIQNGEWARPHGLRED